ncbi:MULTISPECIES: NAD(P)H-binding protein [unclassified Mesorhizobium]|uniref:NAD(P)H-binding protein n=1 Tax=unclassified Mesorhizobium TaxID=325217 RepID=UPI0004654515|nr:MULTISPECIES: NAD(P)H-binding protein [unclassified Mesorhizobium]
MQRKILVTGANGKVGTSLSEALQKMGQPHVLGVRNLDCATQDGSVERRCFDWDDQATWTRALDGVQALYLIKPPHDEPAPAIKELLASCSHLERIVMMSEIHCQAQNDSEPQRAAEVVVERSGISFCILRPNWFFQNYTTGSYAPKIRQQSILETASASQPVSYIDVRDVAAVAALELLNDDERSQHLPLTGREALTSRDLADIIGSVVGRPISVSEIPLPDIRARILARGGSEATADFIVGLSRNIAEGRNAGVTDTVERLTGRKPISFSTFASEYARYFND